MQIKDSQSYFKLSQKLNQAVKGKIQTKFKLFNFDV
jgi:hypothetical protein